MPSLKTTAFYAAVTAVVLGMSPAQADVSVDDVWADWTSYITAMGYQVRASEMATANELTLSDIVLTLDSPNIVGAFSMTLSEMRFTETGDGSVSITMPDTQPIQIVTTAPDADPVTVELNVGTQGWSMVATGDPGNITYTYSADQLSLTLEEAVSNADTSLIPEPGLVEILVSDLSGTSQSTQGERHEIDQQLRTGTITYTADLEDLGDGDSRVSLRGAVEEMTSDVTLSLPLDTGAQDIATLLEAGLTVTSTFALSGLTLSANGSEDGAIIQTTSSAENATLDISLSPDGLLYDVQAERMRLSGTGGLVPLPVEAYVAEGILRARLPVTPNEAEQNYALDIEISDVTMSDLLWMLADPAGNFPRDPASVALAVTGTMDLRQTYLDPISLGRLHAQSPLLAEPKTLNVDALLARGLGLDLQGEGAFVFDTDQDATFEDLPRPSGMLDLILKGGNGFLDTIESMGPIPARIAASGKRLLATFTTPGAGPDTVTSKIEFTDDGDILANGKSVDP